MNELDKFANKIREAASGTENQLISDRSTGSKESITKYKALFAEDQKLCQPLKEQGKKIYDNLQKIGGTPEKTTQIVKELENITKKYEKKIFSMKTMSDADLKRIADECTAGVLKEFIQVKDKILNNSSNTKNLVLEKGQSSSYKIELELESRNFKKAFHEAVKSDNLLDFARETLVNHLNKIDQISYKTYFPGFPKTFHLSNKYKLLGAIEKNYKELFKGESFRNISDRNVFMKKLGDVAKSALVILKNDLSNITFPNKDALMPLFLRPLENFIKNDVSEIIKADSVWRMKLTNDAKLTFNGKAEKKIPEKLIVNPWEVDKSLYALPSAGERIILDNVKKITTHLQTTSKNPEIRSLSKTNLQNALSDLSKVPSKQVNVNGIQILEKIAKNNSIKPELLHSVLDEAMKLSGSLAFFNNSVTKGLLKGVAAVGGVSIWANMLHAQSDKIGVVNKVKAVGGAVVDFGKYMIPFAGNGFDFNDAYHAFSNGKYFEGGLSVASGTIGMVMDTISLTGILAPGAQGVKLGTKATAKALITAISKDFFSIKNVKKIGNFVTESTLKAKTVIETSLKKLKDAAIASPQKVYEGIKNMRLKLPELEKNIESQLKHIPAAFKYAVTHPLKTLIWSAKETIQSTSNLLSFKALRSPKFNQIHEQKEGYNDKYTSKEVNKSFDERMSPRLKEDNSKKLDSKLEVSEYFKKETVEYKNQLSESLKMDKQAPMNTKCKIAICIPAAGHQEGNNIYKTLSNYKDQRTSKGEKIDPNAYELVVFVNHPKDKAPDKTLSEVQRFQNDNPGVPVRVFYKQLDPSDAKIGYVRKYLTDLMLLRHQQAPNNKNDLILVSNDADNHGVSKTYIDNFLQKFDKNPNIDGVLGKIDWQLDAYKKDPLAYIGTRFMQFLDISYRYPKNDSSKLPAIGSSGANFAYKSSIYAAVGGYNIHSDVAEDVGFGKMIKYARKNNANAPIIFGGMKSIIYTDARRLVDALKRGLAPAGMWDKFGANDELRNNPWTSGSDFHIDKLNDPVYIKELTTHTERLINDTLDIYHINATDHEPLNALRFMGVKYTFKKVTNTDGTESNHVQIENIDRLVQYIREFHDKSSDIYNNQIS